jgi:peptidylprolyl isomerase
MRKTTLLALFIGLASLACKNEAVGKTPPAPPPAPAKPAPPSPPEPAQIPAPADVAAAPADAQKTASGLASKVLQKGAGTEKPNAWDKVKVHYTGWMTDGKMFDSSVQRGQPAEFPLNGVIKGWTEGLQLMVVGEKRRFWIPANLAYGDTPRRPGGPSGTLVFDVELLGITVGIKPPAVPADVAAPPKDAKKTKSGLAYKVLQKGKGKVHPKAEDTVTCHYTGWTTDGKMFDSSVQRGQPAEFSLQGVIKGWTEGVPLMVEGEKTRFWIPAELAYGETPRRPGAPAGTLVFDIELISIKVSTVPAAANVVDPAAANVVDAIKLWSDYHDNEVAADEQYKGRLLLVDGVVASIDKDFLDHIVIRLKSRNEFMGTMATMEDTEKRTAASLRRGQRVRVQCRGGTMIMGSPTLSDCTFR